MVGKHADSYRLEFHVEFGSYPDTWRDHSISPFRESIAAQAKRREEESGMPITLNEDELRFLIRLEDEVNITVARELKNLLVQGLASGKDLCVDLERTTELDVTALQLVWAAGREARGAGTGFAITGAVPEQLSA